MFWSKLVVWIKSYWYVPVIVIMIVISSIFLFKNQTAYKLLLQAQEGYRKQIAALEKLWAEERQRKEEIQRQYELTMQLIETKYKEEQRVLEEAEKKRVKELVEKYKDDPEGLSKQLADTFGIKYGG